LSTAYSALVNPLTRRIGYWGSPGNKTSGGREVPKSKVGVHTHTSTALKSTTPPENLASSKLTSPPENPADSKLTAPSTNTAPLKLTSLPENFAPSKLTSPPENVAYSKLTSPPEIHAASKLPAPPENLVPAKLTAPRDNSASLKLTAPPGKMLTVSQSRVLVEYQIRVEEPKSRNGLRTLPLDDALVDALKALRKRQAQESADAGPAYSGGEYVVANVLGEPVHPEWYSDEFGRLLKRAGLRRITLHDSRHTTLTLMEHARVPISVISKWAGQYDSSFTQRTYVHASGDDLKKGRQALARIHKIG